jgi:hypothetical protein
VAQKLLNGPDVVPALEQVSGEGVPEGVAMDGLGDASLEGGRPDGPLYGCLVEVMAAPLSGLRVVVATRSGEDPLPGPVAPGVGVLEVEGVRGLDPTGPSAEVFLVEVAHPGEVVTQGAAQSLGQGGDAVAASLAVAHGDLASLEVDVLDAQAGSLEQTEAAAVQEGGDEVEGLAQLGEQGGDLSRGEHDWDAMGPLGADELAEGRDLDAEDVDVEEQERGEGPGSGVEALTFWWVASSVRNWVM